MYYPSRPVRGRDRSGLPAAGLPAKKCRKQKTSEINNFYFCHQDFLGELDLDVGVEQSPKFDVARGSDVGLKGKQGPCRPGGGVFIGSRTRLA